jgi:hypothetical protein
MLFRFIAILFSCSTAYAYFVFHKHGVRSSRLQEMSKEDLEIWGNGEIIWDFPEKTEEKSLGPTKMSEETPLMKKLRLDQNRIAYLSAILNSTQKEFSNTDLLICNIQDILASSHGQSHFTPMELYVFAYLSSVLYGYKKVKDIEENRIVRFYKNERKEMYYSKYEKIRRIVMISFVFISVILTRNVLAAV